LGRAPYDQTEISFHTDLYTQEGYEADINSYIDSVEYTESFGDNVVPYYRGFETQRGQKVVVLAVCSNYTEVMPIAHALKVPARKPN
jgi:hypothetical protein